MLLTRLLRSVLLLPLPPLAAPGGDCISSGDAEAADWLIPVTLLLMDIIGQPVDTSLLGEGVSQKGGVLDMRAE